MLDDLIYRAMLESDALCGPLARFSGRPAVFYGQAPADNKPGWAPQHYPMIVYSSDERYNPEHKAAGTMTADIFATDKMPVGAEDIAPVLVDLLSGIFLTGEGATICILWNRTDSFQQRASYETEPVISGETVSFDVLQFPPQDTANPDPVLTVNRWCKAVLPAGIFIDFDSLPWNMRPADDAPAIYWRAASMGYAGKASYAVSWMETQLVAHVFAPSPAARQRWIRRIVDRMTIDGEILMPDGSPMLINRIACNAQADPMQQGQLTVTVTFGVLRPHEAGTPLNHINMAANGKED